MKPSIPVQHHRIYLYFYLSIFISLFSNSGKAGFPLTFHTVTCKVPADSVGHHPLCPALVLIEGEPLAQRVCWVNPWSCPQAQQIGKHACVSLALGNMPGDSLVRTSCSHVGRVPGGIPGHVPAAVNKLVDPPTPANGLG